MRYISGADGALQASAKGSNDSSHWSLNNGQLCIAMDT